MTLRRSMPLPSPPEPRGWFRWLHNQYAVRYPSLFSHLDEHISGEDIPRNAGSAGPLSWALGRSGHTGVLEKCWPGLAAHRRGAALAGLAESGDAGEWISRHLAGATFDAVSACQMACHAVRSHENDVLTAVLAACTDLTGNVDRYEGPQRKVGRFAETINLLSTRCVDLILEAALLFENSSAVRIALQHGANPNIPIWLLERSCNTRHCALSHAIATRQRASVTALLRAGADPVGKDFAAPNRPLFEAVSNGWESVALRLLDGGASFARIAAPFERDFFVDSDTDLKWLQINIGPLVPLVPIREKACFHKGHGQGGEWNTFLTAAGGTPGRIQRYAARGLDLRLSAEELLHLVERGHRKTPGILLSGIPEPDRTTVLRLLRTWRSEQKRLQ